VVYEAPDSGNLIHQRQPSEGRRWDSLSAKSIKCIVEIPKGSRNKYEYDSNCGGIKLDRYLASSVVYPVDYGFVPETLALDGDPLDALICVSEPTFPGCIVIAKPLGLFEMRDEAGVDNTIICVPCNDPGWSGLNELDDLPSQLRDEISQFFSIYKNLEPDKFSTVHGWSNSAAAVKEIEASRARFTERHR
jgi:inorganic pyrophosphatase